MYCQFSFNIHYLTCALIGKWFVTSHLGNLGRTNGPSNQPTNQQTNMNIYAKILPPITNLIYLIPFLIFPPSLGVILSQPSDEHEGF